MPEGVSISDGVSIDEAVALALWNNAAFNEALVRTGFSRADLLQAGALSNPTLSVLFPLGPKQLEFTTTFPLEALWLRPRRMAIAALEAQRVAQGLVQNGLDLIRDVRLVYSDLLLARQRARMSAEALELKRELAQIADSRLTAGDISELETVSARVDARQAQEELAGADHEIVRSAQRLSALVGLAEHADLLHFNGTPVDQPEVGEADVLLREAFFARPDVRASELDLEAAGKRAGLAKVEIFTLSGIIDANGRGTEGFEIGPGIHFTIPIFNQNQAGSQRAKADLERAAWHYRSVCNQIAMEVYDAHARVLESEASLRVWRDEILPPLAEATTHARERFAASEVTYAVVLEANRQLLAAQVRESQTADRLRRAHIELERNVGRRLAAAWTKNASSHGETP